MSNEQGINLTNSRYVIFVNLLMSYFELELFNILKLFLALKKTETKLPRSNKNKTEMKLSRSD